MGGIIIPQAGAGLTVELSGSWAARLLRQIPEFVDVFCIFGIEPESGRYVDWGYFESTSEPCPWPACRGHIEVVASVRVPVKDKSKEALKAALLQGCDLLSEKVWKSHEWLEKRNKLAEDLVYWRQQKERTIRGGVPVEVVDARELESMGIRI